MAGLSDELQQAARGVPFWFHSIDLGEGVITPGNKPAGTLRTELDALRLPDLRGKTVLDVGAWDGFFSFEAERLGARRVVALDHYAWSMDLEKQQAYWRACRDQGVCPRHYHEVPELWRPDELPGKKGFDLAKRILGSRVEPLVADFMEMDLAPLGTFDVVLYLGVLYHIQDPFAALRRLASVTGERAVIETAAATFRGLEDHAMCQFLEANELNHDVGNWWVPNRKGIEGMCRAAGFSRVEVLTPAPKDNGAAVQVYRAVAHAWK
jgi:tRNA (mo5U34)-methyltransferase